MGDSAYPLKVYLLTPYKDNGRLNANQKIFNKKLSSARIAIEHTFGVLKQRFRQLFHCKIRSLKFLCHFIRATVVLHNVIIKFNDKSLSLNISTGEGLSQTFVNDTVMSQISDDTEESEEENETCDAKTKRDRICNLFS